MKVKDLRNEVRWERRKEVERENDGSEERRGGSEGHKIDFKRNNAL